jgi:hypothetical protein
MFEKFKRLIDTHRFNRAVKKANEAFMRTGERQYILLQTDGELVVMDKKFFKAAKKEGRIPRDTNIFTLERECLYHTPYNNGTGAITPERIKKKLDLYLRWKKADREHKKLVKLSKKIARK